MSLRIFVTTDNHVGYNELDAVRGDDAANTFAEAMSIAKTEDVDFVLQGGDLFHVNKPSKRSLYSVMKTLRETCLNDKPVEFQILNHGPLALEAGSEFDHANFEDPNFNVGLPVFAISGNHDDAGGPGSNSLLSPLDVLGMSGLINHFGRVLDATNIVVTPILIEKAPGIRVAIYGMASVRDERLYRTFRDNKVKFLRPREDPDSWYNILVVHQNHAQHGPTNFLPEQFLPNFMDLVIWGHEHECLIDPTPNLNKGFQVMQPGSTVATSLSESELKPKHVGILTISPNKLMSFEKFRLKTVRPFAMKTVSLATDASHIKPNSREARAKVTEWLMEKVEELIEEANNNSNDNTRRADETSSQAQPAMLPLIRLRVDYSGGYEIENTTRFSNRFIDRVANSNDILHLIKKRQSGDGRILPKYIASDDAAAAEGEEGVNNAQQVGQLVHKYLESENLQILLERGMDEALAKFVDKDEKLALRIGVDSLVQNQVEKLLGPVRSLSLDSAATTTYNTTATSLPEDTMEAEQPDSPETSRNHPAKPSKPTRPARPVRQTKTQATEHPSSRQTKQAQTKSRTPRNTSRNTSRNAAHKDPMVIEESESEPESILSDHEPAVRPSRQTRNRRATRKPQPELPIEPSEPSDENYPEIGDDSGDMFSPDE